MAFVIPPMPLALGLLGPGRYGISCDIFTRATMDGAYDYNTNNQVIQRLTSAGYNQLQCGDYMNPGATAIMTWTAMLGLLNIQPPGKFESTVKSLQMYRFDSVQIMDVAASLRLGGLLFCPSGTCSDGCITNTYTGLGGGGGTLPTGECDGEKPDKEI